MEHYSSIIIIFTFNWYRSVITFSLVRTGSTPKNGLMVHPGFSFPSLGPGWGLIAIPPVSKNLGDYRSVLSKNFHFAVLSTIILILYLFATKCPLKCIVLFPQLQSTTSILLHSVALQLQKQKYKNANLLLVFLSFIVNLIQWSSGKIGHIWRCTCHLTS